MSKAKLYQLLAVAGGLSAAVATTPVLARPTVVVPLNWTAGTATVDGSVSEWNLATDASTKMCEAGSIDSNGNCNGKIQLSTLYARYNCDTNTMYVLVLKEDGHTASGDRWVKIYDLSNSEQDIDIADVSVGGVSQGYEASFALAAGTYNDVQIHINIDGGRTSSTGKNGYTRSITVPVSCTMPVVDDDADDDGVVDSTDNCPVNMNEDQADVDGDGAGDVCDATDNRPVDDDADDDGVVDSTDNCPVNMNEDQADVDGDGTGDACDATDDRPVDDDADDDTVVDSVDNCPNAANMDQADVDGDGAGDVCDATDDRPVDPVDPVSGGGPNVLCSEIVASNGGPMSLITKFEWTDGGYARESGTDSIDISGDASGGEWSVNADKSGIVDVDAVIIKGATGTYIYSYEPGAKVSDLFSKMDLPLNNGGQVPDISNIQFCQDGVLNGGDEVCLTVAGYDAPACVSIPAGTAYTISVDDAKYDVVAK